jgi:hypothetical protein
MAGLRMGTDMKRKEKKTFNKSIKLEPGQLVQYKEYPEKGFGVVLDYPDEDRMVHIIWQLVGYQSEIDYTLSIVEETLDSQISSSNSIISENI